MLVTTRGIVISSIKFKESSLIVKIFTERQGLQSFIINGVRSKKPKFASALFQPLTLLEIVYYYKNTSGLKRLSEVKCNPSHSLIYNDLTKTVKAFFIAEILYKTLKDEYEDPEMYVFLHDAILQLDTKDVSVDFHLVFLIKLSVFLGFGPSSGADISSKIEQQITLETLIDGDYHLPLLKSNKQRKEILQTLIEYYLTHIEGIKELKSLKVLNELFN